MKTFLKTILVSLMLFACASNNQSIRFSGSTDILGEVPEVPVTEVQSKNVTVHCVGTGLDEQCVTITHEPINRGFDPTPR